jgi:uncharacterized protein with NRDE domain
MCTVTFIPKNNGWILTSSRDEKKVRKTLPPQTNKLFDQNVVFPKDQLAGGTWIAMSDKKTSVCLLNGGFKFHKKKNFSKSRGLVLLERFRYKSWGDFWNSIELEVVEPFTLLNLEHNKTLSLHELVWDGHQKHVTVKNTQETHIWSSATLYSSSMIEKRKEWFQKWCMDHAAIADHKIEGFHKSAFTDNTAQNILMKRTNGIQTVSISRIESTNGNTQLRYNDLLSNTSYNLAFD